MKTMYDSGGGSAPKPKNTSTKPKNQSNPPTQQNNSSREIAIRSYTAQINALDAELAELEKKLQICQSIIGRINSAKGTLNNVSQSITGITGNLDNSLKATSVNKGDIEGVRGTINNNEAILSRSISIITAKSKEIETKIKQKQELRNSLIRARNALL